MSFGFSYQRLEYMRKYGINPLTGEASATAGNTKAAAASGQFFASQLDWMQLLALFGIVKLSKTEQGLKILNELGTRFVDGFWKTLGYMAQASAANPVAAWANPILISGVFERFGLIPPGFNTNYHLGITVISGVKIGAEVIKMVADALPWNLFDSKAESQYPQSLVFAETMQEKGVDPSDIVKMMKASK